MPSHAFLSAYLMKRIMGRCTPATRCPRFTFMWLKVAYFSALIFTALTLVPSGAHLFELPNKIGLPQDQYFVVQNIYRGWALLGFVVFGALLANLVLTVTLGLRRRPFWLPLVTFLCIAGTLVIFFIWTYPANQATNNWTVEPTNWAELRTQWEYSHAASAGLNFAGLIALILSVLTTRERAA